MGRGTLQTAGQQDVYIGDLPLTGQDTLSLS